MSKIDSNGEVQPQASSLLTRRDILIGGGAFLLSALPAPRISRASYDVLEYQNRGDRYEGIRLRPLSDSYIDLISAHIEHEQQPPQKGMQCRLKFFLKQPSPVNITIRELNNRHFYWLDKVQPRRPWRPGADNFFAWPSSVVLDNLQGLSLNALGVVARLETGKPALNECVAPVTLYSGHPPTNAKVYSFDFRVHAPASVHCTLKTEKGKEVFTPEVLPRVFKDRTHRFRVPFSRLVEGWYSLTLESFFLEKHNERLTKNIRFYHRGG